MVCCLSLYAGNKTFLCSGIHRKVMGREGMRRTDRAENRLSDAIFLSIRLGSSAPFLLLVRYLSDMIFIKI